MPQSIIEQGERFQRQITSYKQTEVVQSDIPPSLLMFSGPDEKNHHEIEKNLTRFLYTAKNKVLIC